MNTHADKTQENKRQTFANTTSQKQSGGESTLQFLDNRPETVAQRKLQEMANNSPQVKQFKILQNMFNNIKKTDPIQRQLTYEGEMAYLKPENVEDTNPRMYVKLANMLKTETAENVQIVNSSSDGAASYSPESKKIKIRKCDPTDRTTVAHQIASLTHEMTHARDHLILRTVDTDLAADLGKDKNTGTTNDDHIIMLYKTELKAWKNEAVQALFSLQKSGVVNAFDRQLIDSFLGGIEDIKTSSTNKVRVRIMNYRTEFGIGKTTSTLIRLIEENTDLGKWIEQVKLVAKNTGYNT